MMLNQKEILQTELRIQKCIALESNNMIRDAAEKIICKLIENLKRCNENNICVDFIEVNWDGSYFIQCDLVNSSFTKIGFYIQIPESSADYYCYFQCGFLVALGHYINKEYNKLLNCAVGKNYSLVITMA